MNDYRNFGIDTAMHYPCSNNDHQYKEKVFKAAQYLHGLINTQKKDVFIHCSSALVRTPTVLLAYLCIFKRVRNWKNVAEVNQFVMENSKGCVPQRFLVEQIIQENKHFQDQQVDINTEKDKLRKEMIRKYDQKDRILRELAVEKEDRKRKELERQRYIA